MRNILFLLPLLLCFSCSEEKPLETDLYIYYDFTEGQNYSTQMEADLDKYLQLMSLSDHSRNYGKVKVFPLHDIASTLSQSAKIKEGKPALEGNKYLRQKEVASFRDKLAEKLSMINGEYADQPLPNSHIYHPVCKGFRKLQDSDADRKVVLVYSDMLENSDLANFHSGKPDFEKVKDRLDKACDCGDLMDIELYVVHPIDKQNDKKIKNGWIVWQQYLQRKGLDEDNFHFDTSIDI